MARRSMIPDRDDRGDRENPSKVLGKNRWGRPNWRRVEGRARPPKQRQDRIEAGSITKLNYPILSDLTGFEP